MIKIDENKINNNWINHESRIASSDYCRTHRQLSWEWFSEYNLFGEYNFLTVEGIGLRLQVVLNPLEAKFQGIQGPQVN